jgi:beta-galactosidase/beta-glucuronidase
VTRPPSTATPTATAAATPPAPTAPTSEVTLAPSQRVEINLGAQPWSYFTENNETDAIDKNAAAAAVNFDDSGWQKVGLPYSTTQFNTFLNEQSGGGQGELGGTIAWYRTTLSRSADYAGKKVMVEFEGAHMGAQVYINGHFIQTTSAVKADATATHVVGFLPFIVDLTPYMHFDGTDVLAVKVARGGTFFEDPTFSGAFRFGQSDTGIFRPVRLHVTDTVYIPENVYSGQKSWGTYVATVSASDNTASVRVQTNVANDRDAAVTATLTTQIVDISGNVVASTQDQKTLAAHSIPGADPTPAFDQTLTVGNTPQGITANRATLSAFVANTNDDTVSVLSIFAGTPGAANCHGATVSALAAGGGMSKAAAALGLSSVSALQDAITSYCGK